MICFIIFLQIKSVSTSMVSNFIYLHTNFEFDSSQILEKIQNYFKDSILYSQVPGYHFHHILLVFLDIYTYLWNQLKSIYGKFSRISSFPHYTGKCISYRIYNGKIWHLSSIWKFLGFLSHFFNIIIWVLFMSSAMQNPCRLLIFGCVVKMKQ